MFNLKLKKPCYKQLHTEVAASLVILGVLAFLSVSTASAKGGTASLPSASSSTSVSGKGGVDSVPSNSTAASTSSSSSSGKNGGGSLASLARPEPSNLSDFIAYKQEAIALSIKLI